MKNVFVFGINEDSLVFNNEYESFETFFEKEGREYCGLFLNEFMISEEKSVIIDNELFDYEGGEEELEKFENVSIKYNTFLKENGDYILVSFSLEYDNSWILISKNDYEKLLDLAKEVVME